MIEYKEVSWWYWLVTSVLLIVGLAGRFGAFELATALSALQIIHFYLGEGRFAAFPVQVRVALYRPVAGIPLRAHELAVLGTRYRQPRQGSVRLLHLTRCLSLLPWNRREPLTWNLVWRIFTSRPVKGNILQGLPAAM